MRRILSLTVLAIVLGISCNQGDDVINEPEEELEPNTIESYLWDANQLYFEEIIQDSNHVNFNEPILDANEVDKIYKIIQAVYFSESPQRDTVFEVHRIHKRFCYGLSNLRLRVDTESAEIQNLSQNIIPTGESALDNLLTTYGFDTVRTSNSYPGFPWLSLGTDNALNMIPLVQAFNELEPINFVEFEKECGSWDPWSITLDRDDNLATITFGIGWGDCPSGCMQRKYWEFEVANEVARFIRTY